MGSCPDTDIDPLSHYSIIPESHMKVTKKEEITINLSCS